MGGTLLRPLCCVEVWIRMSGKENIFGEKIGLKLECFDEVEDAMFWLLFFVVEGC